MRSGSRWFSAYKTRSREVIKRYAGSRLTHRHYVEMRVNSVDLGQGERAAVRAKCPWTVGRLHRLHFGLVAVTLALGLSLARVSGHTLPISYLFVVTDVDYVHVELSFNPFELASFSDFDTNKNGRLDPAEVESQGEKIGRLVLENLTLLVDGKKVAAENAGILADADTHHVTLRAHYHAKARGAAIAIESNLQKVTSSSHLTQVNFLSGGERQLAQLDAQSHKATFKPAAPKQIPVGRMSNPGSMEIKKP